MLGRFTLLAFTILAAGCGAQVPTTPARHPVTMAASGPTRCSVWLQGHLAEVVFSSGTVQVRPICDRWVQVQASAGLVWEENELAAVPSDAEQLVCLLQSGALLATVDDGEGAFYGRQACASLLAGGDWRELSPGSHS